MNRGNVLQSSPAQQMLAAGGQNNRWPPPQQSPFFTTSATAPPYFFPPPPLHVDHLQDFPDSLTQLLMGGLVGEEEERSGLTLMGQMQQVKKVENWGEEVVDDHYSPNVNYMVKQENLGSYRHCNTLQFQGLKTRNPTSCITSLTNNKSNVGHPPPDRSSEQNSTGTGGATKKAKIQPSSTQSTFKVRKEKLGDRITALHQLVSPFGKTDTASVLLEAIGYIRFLQNQIEALSLPYLGSGSTNIRHNQHSDFHEEPKKDLRSKGLCLVPVSCTMQVGSDNGADYWTPALNGGFR